MGEQPTVDFQLGALSARTTQIEARQAALEANIDRRLTAIETRVGAVHDVITSGKGGWKALTILGSIVVALSGIGAALVHWLTQR